jgi:hypothetical protein
MSAEIDQPRSARALNTYFVGRRPYEAPEVYAVTDDDVWRLRPDRHDGPLALDWHSADARVLALSHVLLASVARHSPPPELEERFALDVLAALPDDGFVLQSAAIWRWLQEAREPGDLTAPEAPQRSRLRRMRAVFHWKTKAPAHDD